MAVPVRLSVRFRATHKMVALDDAGEAFTLGYAGDINQVTRLKQADINYLSDLDITSVGYSELSEMTEAAESFKLTERKPSWTAVYPSVPSVLT
jgi:uncharacterized protein YqfB (UPF0267 family)